jgi:glutamine synthetase
MAGLDGIKNKIDPGEAMDKDLYDLPPEELEGIPTVCAACAKRSRSRLGRRVQPTTTSCWPATCSPRTRSKGYIELKWEEI